jgi:4-alpha-glucanotransferase
LGDLPLIAEDLGLLTPEVTRVKNEFDFPGMIILQFAFGEDSNLPDQYPENTIVYTGTHDNVPILEWYWDAIESDSTELKRIRDYLEASGLRKVSLFNEETINQDFLEIAYSSPCFLAMLPIQDILGLGKEAIMNVPGTAYGNWEWRLTSLDAFQAKIPFLRELAEKYNRVNL